MSRVIATNEIKEEFDGVLETPLASFPFDFDVPSESARELQTEEVHWPTVTTTASDNSSSQLPAQNDDQNCTEKSNTPSDDSMAEEEEEEEDIATNKIERDDNKIKVGYLNCTQPDCGDKLDTLHQYYEHLRNKHRLSPFQCFCGCKSRFDESWHISRHLRDRSAAKFSCTSCSKVFKSQRKTNKHWFQNHQTGQFQCNIGDCSKVLDSRSGLYSHQKFKHCPESKRLQCSHDGCSASFVYNKDLKKHQLIHLNTKPFHCKWPKCVHRTNQRSSLNRHIRNVHFKKQQQQNGIVDERDTNKYVRVVKK